MKLTADMSFDALLAVADTESDAGREMARRFGANVAVLVVDFSPRRRQMDAFGRVSKLRTVPRAIRAYTPAVTQRGGRIVGTVPNTIFGVFEGASDALSAALDGLVRMEDFNGTRTSDVWAGDPGEPIYPRAALGFGPSLLPPDGDLHESDLRRAFVLGKGVAREREILASVDFVEELGAPPIGVGLHGSPYEREGEAGFPFHIYTDYRSVDD